MLSLQQSTVTSSDYIKAIEKLDLPQPLEKFDYDYPEDIPKSSKDELYSLSIYIKGRIGLVNETYKNFTDTKKRALRDIQGNPDVSNARNYHIKLMKLMNSFKKHNDELNIYIDDYNKIHEKYQPQQQSETKSQLDDQFAKLQIEVAHLLKIDVPKELPLESGIQGITPLNEQNLRNIASLQRNNLSIVKDHRIRLSTMIDKINERQSINEGDLKLIQLRIADFDKNFAEIKAFEESYKKRKNEIIVQLESTGQKSTLDVSQTAPPPAPPPPASPPVPPPSALSVPPPALPPASPPPALPPPALPPASPPPALSVPPPALSVPPPVASSATSLSALFAPPASPPALSVPPPVASLPIASSAASLSAPSALFAPSAPPASTRKSKPTIEDIPNAIFPENIETGKPMYIHHTDLLLESPLWYKPYYVQFMKPHGTMMYTRDKTIR
jgi:hypothetical protein